MRVLVATSNVGKLQELRRIAGGSRDGIEIVGPGELEAPPGLESAHSFEENALLKARYFHSLTGLPTIADDSGLEVEALGGAPGVHSARYAGHDATDEERMAKLLLEIEKTGSQNRKARFVCAAAFVWTGGEKVVTGEARGFIVTEPRGRGGFGYDPLFLIESTGKTFAEMDPDEKEKYSHRGAAMRALIQWLDRTGLLDTHKSSDRIRFPTT